MDNPLTMRRFLIYQTLPYVSYNLFAAIEAVCKIERRRPDLNMEEVRTRADWDASLKLSPK